MVLPLTRNIEVLFAQDSANAIRFVTRGEMAAANLTESTLFALARRNCAQLPAPEIIAVDGLPDTVLIGAEIALNSAYLFDSALLAQIEKRLGGPLAMAVPTRDWVLLTRADKPERVAALRATVKVAAAREPYPVSDELMTWSGSAWQLLAPN